MPLKDIFLGELKLLQGCVCSSPAHNPRHFSLVCIPYGPGLGSRLQ